MAKHHLFLNFPESTNESILQVDDASIYMTSPSPSGTCFTLEITPPGYTSPTVLTLAAPNFNLILNACQIGVQLQGCTDMCPLIPDGIYHYRYSVSPNTLVFVEYNQLRITHLMNKFYKTLCWINAKPCYPENDRLVLIRELQLIESQILTAKHLVEDKFEYETGMEMYRFASKRLKDISFGCHTCH